MGGGRRTVRGSVPLALAECARPPPPALCAQPTPGLPAPFPLLAARLWRRRPLGSWPVSSCSLPPKAGLQCAGRVCPDSMPMDGRAALIPLRKDRLSSELRSQPQLGCISTGLRDHLGTRSGAVPFAFLGGEPKSIGLLHSVFP